MGCCNSELNDINQEDLKEISFDGIKDYAKVIDVYDGDTITIAIKFENIYRKQRCRLLGINSPEIRTKNLEEKEKGFKARDFLKNLILNQIIYVHCGGWDKYGRLLVTIFYKEKNVNLLMIESGHAVKYLC